MVALMEEKEVHAVMIASVMIGRAVTKPKEPATQKMDTVQLIVIAIMH